MITILFLLSLAVTWFGAATYGSAVVLARPEHRDPNNWFAISLCGIIAALACWTSLVG